MRQRTIQKAVQMALYILIILFVLLASLNLHSPGVQEVIALMKGKPAAADSHSAGQSHSMHPPAS